MNRFVIANTCDCIGCKSCEIACMLAHNEQRYPEPGQHLQSRVTVVNTGSASTAVMCHQCDNAPCVASCPTAALVYQNDHVVLDEKHCIGCKSCILACPFGVISLTTNDHPIAQKCDLCEQKNSASGPACVNVCPTNALQLVTQKQLTQLRHKRQQETLPGLRASRQTGRDKLLLSPKRSDPDKLPADERRHHFQEIYQPFKPEQTCQAGERCLECADHANCRWTCPLHNAIPELIRLAKQGRINEAVELSHLTSSMPEVCGRVCPQDRLCEGSCTLESNSGSVTIGCIEKYITDTALKAGWRPDLSGVRPRSERVAIIGAGPAGLACADVLARHGVKAVVYDRHPEIGGLLTFGIPSFKLDKHVLATRREIFTGMGIEFVLNCEIGRDISFSQLIKENDAVFIAPGTYQSMIAELENENATGVLEALPYLIANTRNVMNIAEDPENPFVTLKGKRVVVLGGGDTAMDCLRTAVRQGATAVTCAYRRDEANMPGSRKEVKNAREEGVEFQFNIQPQRIVLNKKGAVAGIEMLLTELGEMDASGRRRPKIIKGSEFIIEADALIVAFGFQAHAMPWLKEGHVECDKWGQIRIGSNSRYPGQTTNPRVFAGGDAVRGADLVVTAMVDGRRAATDIIDMLDCEQAKATKAAS
ncbi:formate-dependent uric acid utilization protein AegA [Buttiauxella selenatireducens]|uniref:Formate-dependent uric acid utilization protein AegA n=1 Tax=Buttiauxella selenatireducens TaxID=3073902 RepID=A0ABY9SJJ8_9ENTR|nr:formate-dependent uric acid utilization protein AegA [Buttiauxella sp. R73]WMY76596.1 formate-dependent uric acid utilization protein AegA [Buttiauxella sp. R73]